MWAKGRQSERVLYLLDRCLVGTSENLVNMGDYCLHIRRAVGRHMLPNGLKVLPEVPGDGNA